MRKATGLAVLAVLWMAGSPPVRAAALSDLEISDRVERQRADREAVEIYRSGLARLVAYAQAHPNLFPAVRLRAPRLLSESEREVVRETWRSFLDYCLALDSLTRFHAEYFALSPTRDRAPSLHVARAAFLAQYRFGLDFIQRAENDPKLALLLNDPVPELGLPRGSYDKFKLRHLNIAASSQLTAYSALARVLPAPQDGDFARATREDEEILWKAGRGKRQVLTLANAANVVKKLGLRVTFPVQAGVSQWMGDTRVLRQGRPLISETQIAALPPRLEPGDVLLQRREWYMSNVGLPGFWSHAALYVGTPAERRAYFDDPEVRRWVRDQGEASGDFERWLQNRAPQVYVLSVAPQEDGHLPRVLESISEGVVFTTLEHSAAADSMVALRPRLSRTEKALALARAFRYVGRPYDFDFDFQTDSALVCTELVYKAYEPAPGFRGLRLRLEEIVGRTAIPANAIARQFDEELARGAAQFEMVLFLDGQERRKTAVEAGIEDFRRSWRRPKWHVLTGTLGDRGRTAGR